MTLAIVLIVLLLTLAFFYLKCSMMQSFMMLWSAVIATIMAFSFYEPAANLFISRGLGLDWALFGCFLIIFIVVFAVLRSALEYFIPSNVEIGNIIKVSTALTCGFLTGLIISGNVLVAMGLLPMHGMVFYSRFDPGQPVVLNSPKKPALSTDGFVTGLYTLASSGSMRSDKSFGVLHTDYLSQIHLNKLKTKDKVLSVCSPEALILPGDKGQKPVRTQTIDNEEILLVRVGVRSGKIEKGGANNASSKIVFFPGQIRLIAKEPDVTGQVPPMAGTATALHPVGFWKNGALKKEDLNTIIEVDNKQVKNGVYWMDVAFQATDRKKATLLQFKQNAGVDLTPYEAVKNSPEIEQLLDNDGKKEETP